jgi:hypothetical protein
MIESIADADIADPSELIQLDDAMLIPARPEAPDDYRRPIRKSICL